MCLPSDALLSYLGFSYLGCGVSLHGCSSKMQPLLLTLEEGYLLTAALPDLQRGITPLGSPAPRRATAPWTWGCSSRPPPLSSGVGAWGSSSSRLSLTSDAGYLLSAAPPTPDLRRGVSPLHRSCTVAIWYSQLLPLTRVVG